MKFQIKTSVLKNYMKHLASSIPPVVHRPEMFGVAIDVYDNRVVFQVRNDFLDLKIEESNIDNLKIISTGKILVKSKMLNEIVQKIESPTIELTMVEKNLLIIKSSDSEYELNLLNSEKYDRSEFIVDEGIELKLDNTEFKTLVNKVIVAGNEKSSRRILQGVNFIYEDGILKSYATDNIRVSYAKTKAQAPSNFERIIPIKTLKEIIKIFDAKDEEIKLLFSDRKLTVMNENILLQTNLIEGKFPNLLAAFPTEFKRELLIHKSELINLIERTTILNPNKTSTSLLVKLIINNNELNFESRELEIGYANVSTKNFSFTSDEIFQISFSPKYIIESIKNIEAEMIKLNFNESQDAFVVNGKDDEDYKSLILPFRT